MNYYTQTIPLDLAEKLKEKGYPQDHDAHHLLANGTIYEAFWATDLDRVEIENSRDNGTLVSIPYYSEVFDWLMPEKIIINIEAYNVDVDRACIKFCWLIIHFKDGTNPYHKGHYTTWHEAANAAIEKALELIKEK